MCEAGFFPREFSRRDGTLEVGLGWGTGEQPSGRGCATDPGVDALFVKQVAAHTAPQSVCPLPPARARDGHCEGPRDCGQFLQPRDVPRFESEGRRRVLVFIHTQRPFLRVLIHCGAFPAASIVFRRPAHPVQSLSTKQVYFLRSTPTAPQSLFCRTMITPSVHDV
jgi:hypothetical protein